MPAENDNEEIINVTANESGDDQTAAPVDRGDNLPEDEPKVEEAPVNLEALEAVAADPKEPAKPDDRQEDRSDARIPKARFDEVNARMKKAEEERAALEARLAAVEAAANGKPAAPKDNRTDLEAAEDYYLQCVKADNLAEANRVRAVINAHLQQQAAIEAEKRVTETLNKRDVETSMVTVANTAIAKFPFLSETDENKNETAIAEVIEWRDYYVAKGVRGDVALERAVNKIGPMYAPKAAVEPPVPPVDPRKKEAIQRNAEAAAAQPAQLLGVGERASAAKYDVTKMTEEEFDALPASERKRLRGDA